jgi:hypothetical protein
MYDDFTRCSIIEEYIAASQTDEPSKETNQPAGVVRIGVTYQIPVAEMYFSAPLVPMLHYK